MDPICSILSLGTPIHCRRYMYMPPQLYISPLTRLFYSAMVAKFVCDVYTRPFLFFLFLLAAAAAPLSPNNNL